MKQFILAVVIFFISTGAYCQKVNFTSKAQIPASQIGTKKINGKSVQYLKSGSLKTGQNYLKLSNGNVLYIEYASKTIKSYTLTKPDGTLLDKLVRNTTVSQYQCNPLFCACSGDDDCNDMFTNANCGDGFCSDGTCVCVLK